MPSASVLWMPLKDQIKNYAIKLVEDRPSVNELRAMAQPRKPVTLMFADDGVVPNNNRLPLIVYRGAVALQSRRFDPAVIVDSVFDMNGWGRSWRDTVYDFVHYHSQIHEVLGVARGNAIIEFGGIKGRRLRLKAGDVAILPAGTGHRLVEATRNFLVVGAYPQTGTYDECTDIRDRIAAAKRIRKVNQPETDPAFGKHGPLMKLWRKRAS